VPTNLSAQVPLQSQKSDTNVFTDTERGYSIRYPESWRRQPLSSVKDDAFRLVLSTPHQNVLVVAIYPLPSLVARYSTAVFDQIAHDHVDKIVAGFRNLLKLQKILREQPEDHSNDRAMVFWQGTSALDEQMRPWALVSTHVIPYGSNFIVNLIFWGANEVEKDGASVDAVMSSLTFAPP